MATVTPAQVDARRANLEAAHQGLQDAVDERFKARIEDLEFLISVGVREREAARRLLGSERPESLRSWLSRHDRLDLWVKLTAWRAVDTDPMKPTKDCPRCGRTFVQTRLAEHMRRVHKG